MTWKVNRSKLVISMCFLLTHSLQVSAYSQNSDELYDEYEDQPQHLDNKETELMKAPTFLSLAGQFSVNVGDTVRLPCLVDRLEGFVILWKKGTTILTVASQIIDKRVRLEEEVNGNYLVLGQVSPEDTGLYTCQVSAYKPTQLTHSLSVRVPPEVRVTPGEELEVRAGDSARLTCEAVSGSPQPVLSWSKETRHGQTDLSDLVTREGGRAVVLHLERVTRHEAGLYVCSADNGHQELPVVEKVRLHVEFSPEISVEEHVVQTSLGLETHLTCIVHGYPAARLEWKKEDRTLSGEDPGLVMTSNHHHHSLILLSVTNSSLGRYYCLASNRHGQATKSILVTGLPTDIRMTSDREGELETQHRLQWEATSRSTILEWKVEVRRENTDRAWDSYTVLTNQTDTNTADLLLSGLARAAVYHVRISARNEFGWKQSDQEFVFGTKGSDGIFKAAMTAGGGTTSFISMISVTMTSGLILMIFK